MCRKGFLGLLICVMATAVCHDVFAYSFNGSISDVPADTPNVYDVINIESAGLFRNDGEIYVRDFNVSAGSQIIIENYGAIHVENYNLAPGAVITQLVSSNESAKPIDNLSDFNVVVIDGKDISLRQISELANGATKVKFKDVKINVDGAFTPTDVNVEFSGVVKLNFESGDLLPEDGVIFSNIINNGRIQIMTNNSNEMFAWDAYESNGVIYAKQTRKPGYENLVEPDVETFVGNLRGDSDNNKLLDKLDGASSVEEINNILSRSGRTNPILLMTGVDMLNRAIMFDIPNASDEMGVSVRPMALISDKADFMGVRVNGNVNIGDGFSIGLHAHGGKLKYSSSIDKYDAMLFGGGIGANYDDGFLVLRVLSGVTVARFDIDAVYDNGNTYKTPTGLGIYNAADVGARFDITDNIFVIPSIGATAIYNKVADSKERDFNANIGADFGYGTSAYDLRYDWALRTRAYIDGSVGGGVRMSVMSEIDGIGGDVSVMHVIDNDLSFTEISAAVHVLF